MTFMNNIINGRIMEYNINNLNIEFIPTDRNVNKSVVTLKKCIN
jgi:hypothetical protein